MVTEPRLPLRHPHELPVYALCVVLNLLIAAGLVVGTVDVGRLPDSPGKVIGLTILLLALVGLPLIVISRYVFRASVRASTVRSSDRQFARIHAIKQAHAERLGFAPGKEPELYVQAGNGTLNAFASQAGTPFTVVYSDLFANTLPENLPALSFIIGHELAHVRCWHTRIWYQLSTCYSGVLPLLGPYMSRLRELSCDRNGAYLEPAGAQGLVLLAAGRYIYHDVDLAEFLEQARSARGVWFTLGQLPRSHPFTLRRVATLFELGMFSLGPEPQPAAQSGPAITPAG